MNHAAGNRANLLRMIRRWQRLARIEMKIGESTANPELRARCYGAWLVYRECIKDVRRTLT